LPITLVDYKCSRFYLYIFYTLIALHSHVVVAVVVNSRPACCPEYNPLLKSFHDQFRPK
jgi:hypothetical protein